MLAPMASHPPRQQTSGEEFEHRLQEIHAYVEPITVDLGTVNPESTHTLHSSLSQTAHLDLGNIAVDASVRDRKASSISLKQWLFELQPQLRAGPCHMTPSLPKDERMKDIMPIIKQAFQRRPVEVVPPEVHPDLSQVVGHFWRVEDFSGLPESLTSLLQRTHDAERREVEHVRQHGWPSGFKINAEGARGLGLPNSIVEAWTTGSRIPLTEAPQAFSRPPYSSVYSSLEVLEQVCEESLRLVVLGKAVPWLKRPHIVSPTNCLFKPSVFEPDGIKKRICWDLTKSGLNLIIHIDPSSLPTIFSLIESMGPGYYMAKSDLKDMFFNFPIAKEHWTLLGFSHPVTGQYLVLPFYPFGLKNAPPDCQAFAEAVRDAIKDECHRRVRQLPSLPGLESVEARAKGLSEAKDPKEVASHVYIDDFQHLTKLLEQGHEVFEIGAKVYEILGLVEKIVKREGPDRVMTMLGFVFNSVSQTLSVPTAKCSEILMLIDLVLAMGSQAGSVSFSILQSLVGKLVWASTGIELGRSFLSDIRQPLDAVSTRLNTSRQRSLFMVPVGSFPRLMSALRWWRSALSANNGSVLVHVGDHGLFQRWRWQGKFGDQVPEDVLEIFTDACPAGGGWSWGSERQAFRWSRREQRHHINILEAYTVLKMLRRDASSFSRTRVLLWCDNSVSVSALRRGSSTSAALREILRAIRLLCLQYHIDLWPVHIEGVRNVVADGLSRGLLSSRCSTWSLNWAIMARWRARFGGFDVDAFTDPSGSGSQAPEFCSVLKPPFARSFSKQKVWAFPPLDLVDKFLGSYSEWSASLIVAVLPISIVEQRCSPGSARLLHRYGSHYGICERISGRTPIACPPIGWELGVFVLC